MTCYIVLGMHRSGTSLVSSMLHVAGIPMGSDFLKADEYNELGYWEDNNALKINKHILYLSDYSWRSFATRKKILELHSNDRLGDMMKKYVEKRRHSSPGKSLWGFKDPRTCVTIWLWHSLLRDPRFVIVHRNRADIIRSLNKAHGKGYWHDLIRHYNEHIRAFLSMHKYPSHHVSYDNLVGDDRYALASVTGLMAFVGRPGFVRSALERIQPKHHNLF